MTDPQLSCPDQVMAVSSLRDPSDISRGIEATPIALQNEDDLEDVSDFVVCYCKCTVK